MNTIVEAAGILLMTRSAPIKFLLLRHSDRWDLPKGHVDAGEAILEAAIRETEEETGIDRAAIEIAPEFRFEIDYYVKHSKRGEYRKRVYYFLGFVESPPQIRLTEHEGFEWFDWPSPGPIQAQTIDPLLFEVAQYLSADH